MILYADLHIHSLYSTGTSSKMTLENIDRYGEIKGLNLIGTGDFTHPKWLRELREKLVEVEGSNLYKLRRRKSEVRYMITGEISTNFEYGKSVKRIHNLLLVPSFEVAEQLIDVLGEYGDLSLNGRPELEITASEFVEVVKSTDQRVEVIPCHIWTSHFSVLGQKGFNSIRECYEDQTGNLLALETGLSADPKMCWRVKELDQFPLVSNSDSHSPYPHRLGREANVLEVKELTFGSIIEAIRKRKKENFKMTIEVPPEYGKYHYTGHRRDRRFLVSGVWRTHEVDVCFHPREAIKLNSICPICGRTMTIGVLQRVEELADRPEGYMPSNFISFAHLIPLTEILAYIENASSPLVKRVWEKYLSLIHSFGNEYNVMLNAPREELAKVAGPRVAEAIIKVRLGQVRYEPGFDGIYGKIIFEKRDIGQKDTYSKGVKGQTKLTDFP
ncbi:MAG: endonuclease Q family protein [Candidatus Baldrarchaeia archaeon]